MLSIEIIDANYSVIKNFTKEEYNLCRSILSYKTPIYYGGKLLYQTNFLLHGKTFKFPTGALPILLEHKKFKNIIPYTIENEINEKKISIPISDNLEEYQKYIITEINKNQRCIIQLPTGAGKSYMISYIAHHLKQPTIIIVPTEEILNQIKEQLEKIYKEKVSIIHGSKEEIQHNIILTTGQTLYSRYELYTEEEKFLHIKCILADEVQYYGANTFFKASFLFPNAYFRLGFSATPLGRSDNADLRTLSIFSSHIITYDTTLIHRVVPVHVVFIKYDHIPEPMEMDKILGEISMLEHTYEGLLKSKARLEAIFKLLTKLINNNLSFICFVDRLEYGENISNYLNIPFVHSNNKERTEIINQLKDEKIKGIISTIGKEGLDIPSLDVVVNTSREATIISLGQKAGRARRKTEEKNVALVFDFEDHQFPLVRRWSNKRKSIYKKFASSINISLI